MASPTPPTPGFVYPCALRIKYDDDAGYRAALRALTRSGRAGLPADLDVDAVSRDEMDYDAPAVVRFMDGVFAATRRNARMARLYVLAAGAMLSDDPETGLAVLMAYDNLPMFHACMAQHFSPEGGAFEDNGAYAALARKMALR